MTSPLTCHQCAQSRALVALIGLLVLAPHESRATVLQYAPDGTVSISNLKTEPPQARVATLAPRKPGSVGLKEAVYQKLSRKTAIRYAGADGVRVAGLDAFTFIEIFVALIHRESGFDPNAKSPNGAKGLGQLSADTASDFNVADPFDPSANLDASARYFVTLLGRFGSLELALAAYNAGPAQVERYSGIPPFDETRQYIIDIFRAVGLDQDVDVSVKASNPQSQPKKQQEGVQSVWEY